MTIKSLNDLKSATQKNKKLFLLLYKAGAEQSDCAKERIEKIASKENYQVSCVDVATVTDIHPAYNITSAPSLLEFSNGFLSNIYKGCQTEEFFNAVLSGTGFSASRTVDGKPAKRVTVYTTPTCTWCTTIKTYLKEKNINFTEVNVAADPIRAEEMRKKSGQQGVPQTDINGHMVVGFDKNRINELLEIK